LAFGHVHPHITHSWKLANQAHIDFRIGIPRAILEDIGQGLGKCETCKQTKEERGSE